MPILMAKPEEQESVSKEKIQELDLVRAFAILGVLIIHVTASGTVELPAGGLQRAVYVILNKLSDFSVPVFVAVSGLVLFYRYADSWSRRDIVPFYRKRLQYIVVPYLIWSVFYLVYNPWLHHQAGPLTDVPAALQKLLWGDASYHLYFIVLIVQFYLLFPLLIQLGRAGAGTGLAGLAVLLQLAAMAYNYKAGPIPHRSAIFLTYMAEFCIGAVIGMHYRAFRVWLEKSARVVLPLGVALAGILAALHLRNPERVRFGRILAELDVHAYSALTLGILILWSRALLRKFPRAANGLTALGAVSFGVYFIHPALLSLWYVWFVYLPGTPAYHLANVGAFLFILAVSWIVVRVVKQSKLSWILFGK